MEWSNEKVLEFIENYEAESILWNPRDPSYKKKHLVYDAWIRIKNNLSWSTTVEDLKKKRDSLMAYYRTHSNKIKKSVKSGAGVDDIYQPNWFAFSAMNSFLRPLYDCEPTIHTQIDETGGHQECVGNEENTTHSANEKNITPSQDLRSKPIGGTKRTKIDLSSEIIHAKTQMQEAFEVVKGSMNDECEMFGKLIASKLRKLKNPNTRDILMNDIHNMVFRACMIDRAQTLDRVSQHPVQLPQSSNPIKQSPLYHFSSSTSSPNSHYQTSLSPQGPSSPNSSYNLTYQYPPHPSSPQSAQIQTYQSPRSHEPLDQLAQSTQQSRHISPPRNDSQIIKSETGEITLCGSDYSE